MKSKRNLIVSLLALTMGAALFAGCLQGDNHSPLSGFESDSDGHLRANYVDAEQRCKNQGKRLPTIRELALEAQRLSGHKRILETSYPGISIAEKSVADEISGTLRSVDHYRPIYGMNEAGETTVDFYYRNTSQYGPFGEEYFVWSSSRQPQFPDDRRKRVYWMYAASGDIYDNGIYDGYALSAVRCLDSP